MAESRESLDAVVAESDLDKLVPAGALCEDCDKEGVMRDIPETRREFITTPDMILTVKKRLYHLGYFDGRRESEILSDETRAAIRAFQTDAGIKVDGWIGSETWTVFEELFSFEADAHLERWVREGGTSSLLHRAVQLRLFAFGLIEPSPAKELVDLREGLAAFARIAVEFHFSDSALQPGMNLPTLKVLFDQAHITQCLSRIQPDQVSQKPRDERKALRRFLVCNGKIELWLLGYNVEPDGTGSFKRHVPATRGQRLRLRNASTGFYYSLDSFCDDLRKTTGTRLSADDFYEDFPGIFHEFAEIQKEADSEEGDEVVADELYQRLAEQPEECDSIWQSRLKELGGRIWDGIRRAWGWFKRLVKRGVQLLGALLKNAVRLAWQLAKHSFGMVKAAIRSFPAAVRFIIHQEMASEDRASVVFKHDGDFDWKVYVAASPDPEQFRALIERVIRRVRQFGYCTRVLGLVVRGLQLAAKFAVTGYFALVMALTRIRKQLESFLSYYLANKRWLHEAAVTAG